MGGDEIVAEWLGDLSCGNITTTTSVQRFCASSKRFKTIKFDNYSGIEYTYVGKYFPTPAVFYLYALLLPPWGAVTFEYADLYEFGCIQSTGSAVLKWIGVNNY